MSLAYSSNFFPLPYAAVTLTKCAHNTLFPLSFRCCKSECKSFIFRGLNGVASKRSTQLFLLTKDEAIFSFSLLSSASESLYDCIAREGGEIEGLTLCPIEKGPLICERCAVFIVRGEEED